MFRLKFPSGAVLELGKSDKSYQGMLYIWLEDIEPLQEIVNKEANDASQDNRNKLHRDKASQD